MCGIVGFTGRHQAAPILLDGLSKLEYRGYDSAGIAVRDGEKDIEIIKAKGRLKVLLEKTNAGESVPGMCGIGHTRWATHGEPSEVNAHPHVSDNGNVAAVHNGIIENYQELKEKLLRRGYSFYSSTDTEVAVKLVDYYYQKYGGSPVEAVRHPHTGYRQCGRLFHCKRGGSCILHTCRTGDLGCYHQGVQYTADRFLCAGIADGTGPRKDLRGAV